MALISHLMNCNNLLQSNYSKVPAEAVVQHPDNGNPPALFMVLQGKLTIIMIFLLNNILVYHWWYKIALYRVINVQVVYMYLYEKLNLE